MRSSSSSARSSRDPTATDDITGRRAPPTPVSLREYGGRDRLGEPLTQAAPWPIVPRTALLDSLGAGVTATPPRSQLLVGPSGTGKTALAQAVAARADKDGRVVVPIVGVAELRSVSLGAMAAALGSDGDRSLDERVHDLIRRVGMAARHHLLVVDDAPLLDDVSAGGVYQLIRVFGVPAVLTARDSHEPGDILERLLREDAVARVEVAGLDMRETELAVRRRLGGRLNPDTLQRVWTRTQGNPLFLRELVERAVRAGTVHRTESGIAFDEGASVTTDASIDRRLDSLGPELAALARLIALTQPVPLRSIAESAHARHLDQLIESSVVLHTHEGIRISHPLFAEAVLRRALPEQLSESRLAAVALLREIGDDSSRLRALRLELDEGEHSDPAELAWAAAIARSLGDHAGSVEFSRRALANGAEDESTRWHLAAALSALGRLDDADAAFAEAWAHLGDSHDRRAWGISLNGDHLAFHRHDPEAALALAEQHVGMLPAALHEALGPELATWGIIAGHQAAVDSSSRFDDESPPQLLVRSAMASVLRNAMGGADNASGDSVDVLGRMAKRFGVLDPLAGAMETIGRVLALISDERAGEAWDLVQNQRLGPVNDAAGMWSFSLGNFCHYSGRPEEGLEYADLAIQQLHWRDLSGVLGAAMVLKAFFLIQLRQRAAAEEILETLKPAQRREPRAALLLAELTAWDLAERGRTAEAAATVLAAGRRAVTSGYAVGGALTMSLGIRIGEAAQVVAALEECAQAVEGRSALANDLRDLARATADGDPRTAVAIAPRLVDAAMPPTALDALLIVRDAAMRAEDRRLVDLTVATLRPLCEQGPWISREYEPILSKRQLEVAALAAKRLSSREIALQLGVSVRTIDNHLAHVYRRLGVSDRRELRGALGETPRLSG